MSYQLTAEQQCQNNLKRKRYSKQNAGIIFKGKRFQTDNGSILYMLLYSQNPEFKTVDWKLQDGTFVSLKPSEFKEILKEILLHVTKCFSKEKEFLEEIEKGNPDEVNISENWPNDDQNIKK